MQEVSHYARVPGDDWAAFPGQARQQLPLSLVALPGAAPVVLLSSRRLTVLRAIDWSTLAFFAAMFVLMASCLEQLVAAGLAGGSGPEPHSAPHGAGRGRAAEPADLQCAAGRTLPAGAASTRGCP